MEAVLLKDTKLQLDPFLGDQQTLLLERPVRAEEAHWQLDVLALLPTATKLDSPGQVPEEGMAGSHQHVGSFLGVCHESRGRGAGLPGVGQPDVDGLYLDSTVGQVEHVVRAGCQQILEFTQN